MRKTLAVPFWGVEGKELASSLPRPWPFYSHTPRGGPFVLGWPAFSFPKAAPIGNFLLAIQLVQLDNRFMLRTRKSLTLLIRRSILT